MSNALPRPDFMSEASRSRINGRRRKEKLFVVLGIMATCFGLLALSMLLFNLLYDGLGRLSWDFMTNFPSRRAGSAGILSAWVGSLLIITVTAVIGIPLGVAAGLYLEEYAPKNWLTNLIEINVTNLAAVPSIVYGLLALGLFVYGFGTGRSVLTAGMTLALLILPIIIVSTVRPCVLCLGPCVKRPLALARHAVRSPSTMFCRWPFPVCLPASLSASRGPSAKPHRSSRLAP